MSQYLNPLSHLRSRLGNSSKKLKGFATQRPKEFQVDKPLNWSKMEEVIYWLDIPNQMANILVMITLYELPRLSKLTRKAPREALTDAEFHGTRVPTNLP